MAKQNQRTTTSGAAAGAATARAGIPVQATPAVEPVKRSAASGSEEEREEIARRAYSYWQARGCPLGSPEEDWRRAEAELQKQATGPTT